MNKAQKTVMGFFIIVIGVIAILFLISIKTNKPLPNEINNTNTTLLLSENVLYYSLTCPHCKIVEQFIEENNITLKINFTQKEVSTNMESAKELIAVGNYCKLQAGYVGAVPLFYSNKQCYLGDKEIIDFLKNKTGVK